MWFFFFFNDTATTEIYTLSLHDALPILTPHLEERVRDHYGLTSPENAQSRGGYGDYYPSEERSSTRSEEHTSELQSRQYLVCRLLLEKKKQKTKKITRHQATNVLVHHAN